MRLPKLWERLTLRLRTAIILTAFIWTTALIVSVVCRVSIQALMLRRTNIELLEDLDDFVQLLDGHRREISDEESLAWNRRVAVHQLHHLFIRILDEKGELVWESISVPYPNLSLHPADFSVNRFHDIDNYRVVQRHFQFGRDPAPLTADESSSTLAYIQVGCSLDLIESAIVYVESWLLLILGVLVLVGPLISIGLANWLLSPLQHLTYETDRLKVENANDVLSLKGSGDELDRLAKTINLLLTRVRSQLQQNEDWIANSAHQLRSPLAAIMSNVEVVQSRLPEGKSSEMLEKVLNECGYLNKLVNQLLVLGEAKAERSHPNRKLIRWDDLVRRSSDFFEALANAKDIEIRFSKLDPCTVLANSEHLRFVIHNLIDNAIKYTPSGGKVEVSIQMNPSDDTCCLQVADNGIGISERDIQRVGLRFFRSDSGRDPENTPRGTGLGLNIVKTIVESIHGTLEIESRQGKGTTVSVRLPTVPTA